MRTDRAPQVSATPVTTSLIPVNVFPVSNLDNADSQFHIKYFIYDPISALTQSESIIACKLPGARRVGVCCQALNSANNLLPDFL